MLAVAAGAAYAVWRGRIGTYVAELGELLLPGAELAGDACAERREHARAIIAASKKMGTLGPGWNKGAHDAMCALCRESDSDARFPRYYACLAGIRRALRCRTLRYI
jgi:hypothetical protein